MARTLHPLFLQAPIICVPNVAMIHCIHVSLAATKIIDNFIKYTFIFHPLTNISKSKHLKYEKYWNHDHKEIYFSFFLFPLILFIFSHSVFVPTTVHFGKEPKSPTASSILTVDKR